ncbi:hypothetical protein G3M80_21185 [Bacillus altitudinis]|uniref:hypothetical protein n=1 Tax=Bacillus altitudinis TaxID=293387 RepID=UPI00064CA506|nr:hypothetical protein [Bacillus altitudinis]KLV14968.1 hypothetical protein ABW03_19315 [Bacillus altitudinis]QII27015.1 hypothetical protein G3M80_21185 [Bacillus altitudinis]
MDVKKIINSLRLKDKVSIVYADNITYEGYVHSVSSNHLVIQDRWSWDSYRTFNNDQIIEIGILKGIS